MRFLVSNLRFLALLALLGMCLSTADSGGGNSSKTVQDLLSRQHLASEDIPPSEEFSMYTRVVEDSLQDGIFENESGRNLQTTSLVQPSCQNAKFFPMIFGLDQTTSDGCAQHVELTGFDQDLHTGDMVIAGYVPTSLNCLVLGVTDTKRRAFISMTNSQGVVQWTRHADNAGTTGTDVIMSPKFFRFTDPSLAVVHFILAVMSKVITAVTMSTTTPWGMTSVYNYGPTFRIVKIDPTDGVPKSELQYTITSSTMQFNEFNLATDPYNGNLDSAYVATSILSNHADWNSGYNLGIIIQFSVSQMSVNFYKQLTFAFYNIIWDIQNGVNYLYVFGRVKDATNYTPFIAKLKTLDMTMNSIVQSSAPNPMSTVTTIFNGRLAVCELQGYFFFGHSKNGVVGNLQLSAGITGTTTVPSSVDIDIIYNTQFTTVTASTILVFDMFYQCSATAASTVLIIMYASQNNIYITRIDNPYANIAGNNWVGMKYRKLSRGLNTKIINSLYGAFTGNYGFMAFAQQDYLSTTPTWYNRIVIHKIDFFTTATVDYYTSNCLQKSVTNYDTVDSSLVSQAWATYAANQKSVPVELTADAAPISNHWSFVGPSNTVLMLHGDPTLVNSTNIKEKYYMLFDTSYTELSTCLAGASCPIYTIDCSMPYDWYPKQYTFNINTAATALPFNLPDVMDCIGRTLKVYESGNNIRLPSGSALSSLDSSTFSVVITEATQVKELTVTVDPGALDYSYLGSRVFKLKAKLGSTYDKNFYFRVNMNQDISKYRVPKDIDNTVACNYDKIYPFLIGHATQDVNVTYVNMDAYGNFMYAGYGSKSPYGFNNATQQGYIALMDQKGIPYWIFMMKDNFYMGNTVCTYMKHQVISSVDYVYAMCNGVRFDLADPVNANYKEAPVLIKLKHDTGETKYMRYLPVDAYNNIMSQHGLYTEFMGSDIQVAVYRYRYFLAATTAVQTFAAIRFNDQTMAKLQFNIYITPDPIANLLLTGTKTIGHFPMYVLSDSTSFWNFVYGDDTRGLYIYKISMSTLLGEATAKIVSGNSGVTSVEIQPCFYDVSDMIVPTLDNIYVSGTAALEKIYLTKINRNTLVSINQVMITFTQYTNLKHVGVTVDPYIFGQSQNIYLYASQEQLVFFKFSSALALVKQKFMKTTGTSANLYGKGIFYSSASIFVVYGGTWISGAKQSVVIMRSNTAMDFSAYTCGLPIKDFQTWDTDYYPTVSAVTPSAALMTALAVPGVVTGINYPYSNWPLLTEAFTFSLHTGTFDTSNAQRLTIGAEQVQGFYKYPENQQLCSMYEIYKAFQDVDTNGAAVSIYEFKIKSGSQTIAPRVIAPASCQNRVTSRRVLDPRNTGSTASSFSWISLSATEITVDTNSVTVPESAQVTVRYFDLLAGEANGFFDHNIHIRMVNDTNYTTADGTLYEHAAVDIPTCTQNVYPLSYGGYDSSRVTAAKGNDMIGYGISYVTDDGNLLVSGKTMNLTNDDGASHDGFVMRITPVGFIQWISYLSSKQGQDEYVGNTIYSGVADPVVYSYFHSGVAAAKKSSAIAKLTYGEGKMIWARQVIFQDGVYLPQELITPHSGFILDADPTDLSRMMMGSMLSFGSPTLKSILPAISVLKDDGTQLNVVYNYFIKLQQGTQTAAIPGISSFAFGEGATINSFFFGVSYFTDATNNFRNLMFGRIDHSDGSIIWVSIIPGSAALAHETMSQPHIIQRKTKLFTVSPVVGTGSDVGRVYVSSFQVADGVQIANKLVTVDTTYQISNAQLVPDMSNSATSNFVMYLVLTFKTGNYMIIQQINEGSMTFLIPGLKFHPNVATTYFSDTLLNNHKYLAIQTPDFFFILSNSQRFFQTTKTETVVFKQDYNLKLSGMHSCHQWTAYDAIATTPATYASTSLTAVTIPKYIVSWHALQTLDSYFVRLEQKNFFPDRHYPQREAQPGHPYDEMPNTQTCNTIQAVQLDEILGVNVLIGDTELSGAIDDTTFKQCQKMPYTFSMKYMDSETTSPTADLDNFIQFDSTGVVTVDTSGYKISPPVIKPSFRQLKLKACNSIYPTVCSDHTMPIMIYDPDMPVATKGAAARASACSPLKREWPKVLSDGLLAMETTGFTGMHIDQTQGNIFLCGYSNLETHFVKTYAANYKKVAITFLLDNMGDVLWHYAFRSIKNPTQADMSAQSCKFSATGDAMFTLLYDHMDKELSIMKQGYDKGAVIFTRKLYGTFNAIDGTYSMEQDYNAAPLMSNMYIAPRYIAGAGASNSWHLYKVDVSTNVPRQNWHSYRAATLAQELQGIDGLAVSTSVIIAASFFDGTAIRKHALLQLDKNTGAYSTTTGYNLLVNTDSKVTSTTATTVFRSQGLIVDKSQTPTGGGLYYSFVDKTNNLIYARLDDVTFSINYQYSIALGITITNPWVSVNTDELDATNGYAFVFIASDTTSNTMFMFKKSDGSVYKFARYSLTHPYTYVFRIEGGTNHKHTRFEYYRGSTKAIYLSMTAIGYVNTAEAGVINKLKGDWTAPETCRGLNDVTLPTRSALLTVITPTWGAVTVPTATIIGTYVNLLSTEKLFAEIINYSLDLGFGFRSAELLGCEPPPCSFTGTPSHVQIVVNDDASPKTQVQTIFGANQCANVQLLGDWSVDRQSPTKPAWIDLTHLQAGEIFNGTGGTYTIIVTPSEIGTYSVRTKYYSPVNNGYFEQTFIVDVYPYNAYSYVDPPASTNCVTDIYPLTFGNYADITVLDGDYDGTNFLICGATKNIKNARNTGYESAYVQSINKNININYQLIFEMGIIQSQMQQCQFGGGGFVFFGINARKGTNFDKIYMYKYLHASSKFVNGKMFATPGESVFLHSMAIEKNLGDSFYAGSIKANRMLINQADTESFIMKLNTNMQMVYMRTFQGSPDGKAGALLLDKDSGVYAHIMEMSSATNGAMRLVKLAYSGTGAVSWGFKVYDAANLAYPRSMGGIARDAATYVYSCMTISKTSTGATQTLVMKFEAGGNKIANQQLNTPSAIDCSVFYHTPSTKLLLSVSYSTGESQLMHFNTDTNTLTLGSMKARLRFTVTGYLQSKGNQRMTLISSDVWIFYPSKDTAGTLQSMFITKLQDVAEMNWLADAGCTDIHQRDTDTTVYNAYAVATYGDTIDDTNSIASTASNTITSVNPDSLGIEIYFKNPDQIAMYYDLGTDKPSMDLKFSYSIACSVWSRPKTATLINKILPLSGYSVNGETYVLPQTHYVESHCQGLPFTYTSTLKTGAALPSWIVFDPLAVTFDISPADNALVGLYEISITATITHDLTFQQKPALSTETFQMNIKTNLPPTADPDSYNKTEDFHAHHNWAVLLKNDGDIESNDPAIWAEMVEDPDLDGIFTPVASNPTGFTVVNDTLKEIAIAWNNPPQPVAPADYTNYHIRIKMWDIYTELTPNVYFINMTIRRNYPPYMKAPLGVPAIDLVIPAIQIPFSFSKVFWYSNFADDENDVILIDCSDRTYGAGLSGLSWTTFDYVKATGKYTLAGQSPKDNTFAGNYLIKCKVEDEYKDGNKTEYIFTMTVNPKPSLVVVGGPSSISTRLPNATEVTTISYSSDIDSLAYRKVLYVNNTIWTNSAFGTWMTWDEPNQVVKVTPKINTQAGAHALGVMLNDGITPVQWLNFTITVIGNFPLVALVELPNKQAIVDNKFWFHFDKDLIFENPEADRAQFNIMKFRLKDSSPEQLPYFMDFYPNGTLFGLGSINDINTYVIECVGVDDADWETIIEFTITIKPCYYKCSACWNTDYNTCQECRKGYFLLGSECNDFCPTGSYADNVLNQCFLCKESCKMCFGPDSTAECTVCNAGYYKLGMGCYGICPDGYWGDNQDFYCKPCNEACTKCNGPLSTQCSRCADLQQANEVGVVTKLGYLLVGTQCQVPKCGEGQYFKWDTVETSGNTLGICDMCDKTCKKCVGPQITQCVQCATGLQLIADNHTCVTCEKLNPGLTINEEMECEDRCGDGVIVDKPCDDGNTLSGDGCSKNCYREFGYVCDRPGILCREVIPPTFKITANSMTNQHFIEFSEPILITKNTTFGPENMIIQIVGKRAAYKFSWRLLDSLDEPTLITGREIIRFSVKIFDIMTTLTGAETVRISFADYNQIKDRAGNFLVNNSNAERNPAPFFYVSDDEANAVAGGGESMKYAFLSALGFQLGLKVIINGSMQYLWGLVHALQVFQYLLLMNIDFPPNLPAFTSYFSIASGDPNSMGVSDYIPDIKKFLIHVEDIEGQYDNELLPPKFVEQEMSPYFIIAYSDKLSIWMCALFVLLPILLIMNKLCKKVKVFENMLGAFFFNGPLRTLVEMYFEMVIQVVVNTSFVKFRNRSQIIATAVAFGFGAFSLLLPFILMTVIYANRKKVRKRVWKVKLGMLTDEFSQKSILQLYYYPCYLFQRMTFSGTIVFLYNYPLIQCFIAATANVSMALYMVIIRPYKEENQQTTQVIDEMILFICILFFVYIYLKQDVMDIEDKKSLGWIIIMIMMFSILKNLFVVMYFGFLNMRKKMKAMFSAEDEQLDSPHTSDGNSDTIDSVDTDEIEEEVRKEEYEREEYNETIKMRQVDRQSQKQEQQQMRQGVEFDMYGNPMPAGPYNNQQMMMSGYGNFSRGGMSPARQQTPVYMPGQMAYEQEEFQLQPEIQDGPQVIAHQAVEKPLRKNNFFDAAQSPDNHLKQLEEVAQDYGQEYNPEEYGYGEEYGQEGYGQEGYGQEGYGQEEVKKQEEAPKVKGGWDNVPEESVQEQAAVFNFNEPEPGREIKPKKVKAIIEEFKQEIQEFNEEPEQQEDIDLNQMLDEPEQQQDNFDDNSQHHKKKDAIEVIEDIDDLDLDNI